MKNTLNMEYTALDHIKGKDKIVAGMYARLIDELRKFGPNRFHHTIKLANEKDIDKELINWLNQAYDLKK